MRSRKNKSGGSKTAKHINYTTFSHVDKFSVFNIFFRCLLCIVAENSLDDDDNNYTTTTPMQQKQQQQQHRCRRPQAMANIIVSVVLAIFALKKKTPSKMFISQFLFADLALLLCMHVHCIGCRDAYARLSRMEFIQSWYGHHCAC